MSKLRHHPRHLPLGTALLVGASLGLGACQDTGLEFEPAGSSTVTLAFENLPPLEAGLNYHAWVVKYDNMAYWGSALGIFNINEAGQMVDPVADTVLSGEFTANVYAYEVYGVQVTIEDSQEILTQPSNSYVLGGTVSGGMANLTLDSWMGMGIDFAPMEGSFMLMTPSDEDDSNELSGLWFVEGDPGDWSAGLYLPDAPDGWDYEGWVVLGTDTISTGKFYSPIVADTTDLYGGPSGAPLLPGQDFLFNPPEGLTFPTDLSGGYVLVTMEPWETWDVELDRPFPLKMFEGQIPANASSGTSYTLASLFSSIPTGTATVQEIQ